jgi:hypothetical protein
MTLSAKIYTLFLQAMGTVVLAVAAGVGRSVRKAGAAEKVQGHGRAFDGELSAPLTERRVS